MKFYKSRLQKLEEKRSLKQAVFFFLLTLILILVLFFLGLPLVIKVSVFLGNQRSVAQPNENNQLINPVQPRFSPLPSATNSAVLAVNGSASAGMKIRIFLNDKLLEELTANKDGEFLSENFSLKEGKNLLKAISLVNNKESEPVYAIIFFKKNPPRLEIEKPQNRTHFYDKDKEITIEGVTDPGAAIFVNEHLAMVDGEGNFSLKFNLEEGDNELDFVAQDEAGNQTKTTLIVNYSP